jgi:hypothetical protein
LLFIVLFSFSILSINHFISPTHSGQYFMNISDYPPIITSYSKYLVIFYLFVSTLIVFNQWSFL